nr:MAG TPA: hypothetical protein [Caudoviricetes sp.]
MQIIAGLCNLVRREGEAESPEPVPPETAAPSFVNFRRNNQGG